MTGLLSMPFCPYNSRRVSLRYLPARWRYTTGDLLEATIQDNVIVLKPKVVVDRAQAWAKIEHAMASVQDRAPNPQQSPQEQEEEIAEIIKEYRHDHAKRRP